VTLEAVPAGQVSDGFGLVLFVPTIADTLNPTVAELTAAGVKKITYSVTGDGYKHDTTVNTVAANRLTLAQVIQYDGTITDDLEITFVYTNTAGDVVRLALPQGQAGYIVERWAVDNAVAIAAAQIVDVIPIKASIQRKNAPATNTELTRTQKLNVTGPVQRDVPVHA
jgi:hypothetical protein